MHFADGGEDVAGPLLDEGHEGAVAEGAVGPAEGEVVGEGGDGDAEVGGYAAGWGPEVVEGGAVCDEWEAGEPGGVEAGGADDDVDVVVFFFVVDEAG